MRAHWTYAYPDARRYLVWEELPPLILKGKRGVTVISQPGILEKPAVPVSFIMRSTHACVARAGGPAYARARCRAPLIRRVRIRAARTDTRTLHACRLARSASLPPPYVPRV